MKRLQTLGSQQRSALDSLSKIAAPLSEFAMLLGLSIAEIEVILRESAVKSAEKLQSGKSGRSSISAISATTGLSRTIVSRILKVKNQGQIIDANRGQFTNRVLGAWHRDPKYVDANGEPAAIDIFGRGITFESLVRKFGGGLPVRAILDELVRVKAIEVLPSQRVVAKSSIAIARGFDTEMIESIGARVSELLFTMLGNLKNESPTKLIATISADRVPGENVGLVRKEITNRGVNLLSNIEETIFPENFSSKKKRGVRIAGSRRVSVTLYYYDDESTQVPSPEKTSMRKNLKRKR